MTIFRYRSAALLAAVAPIGCQKTALPAAENCPKQELGFELQQYKVPSPELLPKCLTEQAVKLSAAGGTADEVASAVVTACNSSVGIYESFAGIRRFSQRDLNAQADGQAEVREAAKRYALTRVVQVRAGECSKK
ncbi:MAG TPA: hypothetical protein VFN81_00240 [Sphingomicrobium sp.]|jgi:hypothetical protein|nr:hypothetical protein [Sphingomicrobium sp.]